MIDAAAILARLQAQCATLASTEDPAHLETLERTSEQLPAVSVYLLSDAPGFVPLSGLGQYRRRYEVRLTAATDADLHAARAEIHASLLTGWNDANDDWAQYFAGRQSSNAIRWVGGQMVSLATQAQQWRDVFELQLCDPPST
jgi:hypothetical protein